MDISFTARNSPYKGLIPYSEADAPFFFGRDKETRLIIANMFAASLTLLYGASGVGKSSVLRAGVSHQLRRQDDLIVVPFSDWQNNPVEDLIQAIARHARASDGAAQSEAPDLRNLSTSISPRLSLAEYLRACYRQTGRHLMIILDQFEEYYLYHPQDDAFADEFPKAVLQTDVPVSFLISIREDSLAKLDRFEGRIPTLFDNYLRVDHLNYEAARQAIEKPVEEYNNRRKEDEPAIRIEPALTDAVLQQVQTGKVILGGAGRGVFQKEASALQVETPFLQMVMMRLWDEELRAGSQVLRLASLDALGGAGRIVRTHLDETMRALSPERQDIAAKIFHYLVTPSKTKIAHTSPDLAQYAGLPQAQIATVLEELASSDTRILRGIEPPSDQPRELRYEIFHDVLAAAVLDWRARHLQKHELAERELTLAAERRRSKRLRRGLLLVAGLLLLMTGLSVWVYKLNRQAAEEKKRNDAATALYINGLNSWNQRNTEGVNEAIGNFNRALEINPNYALAYVGLAESYNKLATSGSQSPREAFPKARDAATKALALDKNLSQAHAALAFTSFRGDWNWSEAEKESKEAIKLDPNYSSAHQSYATFLAAQGRFDESLQEIRRLEEINKKSPLINAQFGLVHYFALRFDDSIKENSQALELDPTYWVARRGLGLSYAEKGMYQEAIAELMKVTVESDDSPIIMADYAYTLGLAGDRPKALAKRDQLLELSKRRYISAYFIATIHAGLKEKDQAFEWLERAFVERADSMVFLGVDPKFQSLHSDPRFKNLLGRMNLH
ncbi:MAG TPA: AAA family ATPase [Pyrinomonadaceae bacterium]|nr:AAA family ATPase [Pyrinomonadaceae bacterium]